MIKTTARKILLPRLSLTRISDSSDGASVRVSLQHAGVEHTYHVSSLPKGLFNQRHAAEEGGASCSLNLFPLVLEATGAPWAEANIYLVSRLLNETSRTTRTYSSIAEDLAAYRRFLDDSGLDWLVFPSQKLNRPTYRFNGHLVSSAVAGEIAPSTAKRRMSTVVSYYRWLQTEDLFHPENDPWKEGDRFVAISSNQGGTILKKVAKSDLSIRFNESEDPYNGTISDGGKLRPLSYEEQGWVLDALDLQGNPEMMLIHLFALLTGARIQTILTCKVRHVLKPRGQSAGELISLPVGPGSGIDTKLDKGMVLYMPAWFYNRLRVYAQSDRAKRRRERAQGGDSLDQYIFLSVRAAPFYSTKADQANYDPSNRLRYSRMGQGVRQFIFERVIARIRSETSPKFHYRFHDLRATFGMNLTDKLLQQVQSGKISLHQARENLRMRMGHKSSATTDLYLDHRAKRAWIREANDDYDLHLQQLAERSMEGI